MDINFIPNTVKSELVYEGKRINVRKDWVDCGLDSLVLREVVEHPGAVVIVPICSDGSIILVKQFRHALSEVTLECPAGTREIGEEPLSTAKRELAEEVKKSAKKWDFIGHIYPVPGLSNERQELYVAKDLAEAQGDLDPGEFIEICSYTLDQIKRMIISSEITDSKTIAAIFIAEQAGYCK